MPIKKAPKTFRGILGDTAANNQDTISLEGSGAKIGYRITKFQLMPANPGTADYENIVKVYKTKQDPATVVEDIDFSDSTLLAAGFTEGGAATNFIGNPLTVIFDQEVINQDIYIVHFDAKGALSCNYYLELEEVTMSDGESAVVNFNAALIHNP